MSRVCHPAGVDIDSPTSLGLQTEFVPVFFGHIKHTHTNVLANVYETWRRGGFQFFHAVNMRLAPRRVRKRTKDFTALFPIPPGRAFFRRTWTSVLLREIRFLEYLRIIGEIRSLSAPICYIKKLTIWKEVCVVHVSAVIHNYEVERACIEKVLLMERMPW